MNDNFSSAIEECDRILEKNGSSFLGRVFRAFAYIKKGLFAEAINDLNEAEKLQPNTFEVYFHRGIANFYSENFKEASEDFNKALEVDKISKEQKKTANKWITKLKNN